MCDLGVFRPSCRAGNAQHTSRVEELQQAIREKEDQLAQLKREHQEYREALLSGSVPEALMEMYTIDVMEKSRQITEESRQITALWNVLLELQRQMPSGAGHDGGGNAASSVPGGGEIVFCTLHMITSCSCHVCRCWHPMLSSSRTFGPIPALHADTRVSVMMLNARWSEHRDIMSSEREWLAGTRRNTRTAWQLLRHTPQMTRKAHIAVEAR